MTILDQSAANSQVNRSEYQTNIHYLFIFNKSGTCIYARNVSKRYKLQENLITGFCTAFMSFSMEMIGKKIKSIEMGNVKFLIFEKSLFNYGLLCNSIENLELLEKIIEEINNCFINYVKKHEINIKLETICDKELDVGVDSLFRDHLNKDYDLEKEAKMIEYLQELILDDELKGTVLLSDTRKIIYSSLNNENLRYFLKEIDFRVKICNNSILKLFYTSKNNELILSENIEDSYFLILVFDITTKFGVAEFYIHKAVKFIKRILLK